MKVYNSWLKNVLKLNGIKFFSTISGGIMVIDKNAFAYLLALELTYNKQYF
ncbi:hypothetical protein DZE40_001590 [Clostridium beijerinckii]|uniref:hypothetical protein n=1 Tax=Clostridium beijerinckii TaxID=1520 RepID=UPI00156F320D|nr:hypothetical protein [Clostridium beijerinckii]NRY60495.1 hypothetical protein [Clostridium beijerinckii]